MGREQILIEELEAMQVDFLSLTNKVIKDAKRHEKIINLSDKQQYENFEKLKQQYHEIQTLNQEIEKTQAEVVFTLGAVGESRSKETGYHVKRVAEYSKVFALHYGLDEDESEMLRMVSPMHDIGKVAIPDNILNKPGKLTDEEFTRMKEHAVLGHEMLKHSDRPLLKAASIVAQEHHEKYDGTGYPNGTKDRKSVV